ncbi:MAG: efflux RND transporter permease subunit [Candidatus Bruticola sp.]
MAKFFIHRPVLAIVISLVILLAGLVCIYSLPVAQYPEITPPVIQIDADYTGANAQVLEETVASCIEQQINGAEGMLYMRSICANSGHYTLQITFDLSRDQDMAMVDVQNRLSKATSLLPSEVNQSGVSVKKQSTQQLMYLNFYSKDGSRDDLFVSNYCVINIIDQLARLNGVGSVAIMVGQRDYSMRLWIKPDILSKLGVTVDDIVNAIQSQNVQAAAGSIGDPPQETGIQFQYPVNVKGRLVTPEEFGNVIIRTQSNGAYLRVRDVARVELGANTYSSEGQFNGGSSVLVAIYQQPSANAVALAKDVRAKLVELSSSFPAGLDYKVTYDATIFVVKSIEEVVQTLFEAIVLVLIVVFVFLGNFRATLVPILAVPVSLVGTFAGFAALGFSINLLTMFGMVLAVGIVVDDAIVVVEAVELHIEHGLSPMEATEKAMDEVSGPVVAIALVLCSVFVPVAFMGGMTGVMYEQFAVTLAVSVLLSALVALTMTPALCSMLLRPRSEKGVIDFLFGWFFKLFDMVFGWLTKMYTSIVRFLVTNLIVSFVIIGAVYYGAYYLMSTTPTGFIPIEDQGTIIVSCTLPSGASLERTKAVVKKLNDIMMKHSDAVENTIGLIGYNIMQGNMSSNSGASIAILKDWDLRKTPETQLRGLMAALTKETAEIKEASTVVFCPPPVPGLGMSSSLTMEFQDRSGGEIMPMFLAAKDFIAQINQHQEVFASAYTMFNPAIPMLKVDIDRDKLQNLNIPVKSAFLAMQINLGGYFINQFNQFGRTWRVMMQAESEYRRNPSDIGSIYLRSQNGNMVPLSTVSTVTQITGPEVVLRYNLYRAIELNANTKTGISSGQGIAALENLASKLPNQYGFEWTGMAYQEKEASGQTAVILGLGLVFVFLFLAAQYESWGIPFAVLLSMPTVVLGALIGVNVSGLDLNIYVQIGILTLIGLSAKNAILIVEYAKANYDNGMELIEATVEGARVRFRPILMTSFAFILGVVPLARAEGASAVCRSALGISVMCGMLAATLIGVFIIPALYVTVQRIVTFVSGGHKVALASTEVVAPSEVAPKTADKSVKAVAVEESSKTESTAEKGSGTAEVAKPSQEGGVPSNEGANKIDLNKS